MTETLRIDDNGRGIWLGDKHIAWATVRTGDVATPGRIHRNRQAIVPLENGFVVSIIWGTGTYSDNYDADLTPGTWTETPKVVEVAVRGRDAGPLLRWSTNHDDTVCGYVDVTTVSRLIIHVAAMPSDTTVITFDPWAASL